MKKCILFAGAVGCSKTPVSIYLSQNLNLPIFNNDAIRSEVIEDLGSFNKEEYIKRRDERLNKLVQAGRTFILDASIDREYKLVWRMIEKYQYEYFLISFDLGKDFLIELYKNKDYQESLERIDELFNDHENFLKENRDKINIIVNDKNFKDRLNYCLEKCKSFL